MAATLDRPARPDARRARRGAAARTPSARRSSSCSRRSSTTTSRGRRIEAHGDYVFGVFLVAVAVPEEDRVYYQEIDFVLTRDRLVTVAKTPPAGSAVRLRRRRRSCMRSASRRSAMFVYRLVDEVAERYLDLIDDAQRRDRRARGPRRGVAARAGRAAASRRSATTCSTSAARSLRRATPSAQIVDDRVELDGDGALPARGRAALRRRLRQAPARVRGPRDLRATSSPASATTSRRRSRTTRTR